ncbi:VanZ family protein [Sporolactobacillus sp. THM7-4]|nr:VanZ family protein [Sporolactobacillus sp. THM7-4]
MINNNKKNIKLFLLLIISILIITWYFIFNYERDYGFFTSSLEIIVNIVFYNVIVYLLSKHIKISNIFHIVMFILFQVYLWFLYLITVYISIGFAVFAGYQHQFRGSFHIPLYSVNIIPFRSIIHTFISPPSLATYVQVFGNIVLFAPLCFFLLYFHALSVKKTLLLVACSSISIEVIQLVQNFFLSTYIYGVNRSSDIDDVILNTCGSLIGILVYKFASLVKFRWFN